MNGLAVVEWNAHRIYGPGRMRLLTEGWEVLDTFGLRAGTGRPETDGYVPAQPVIVLRRP